MNILHLSDIHFKFSLNGTIHDLDGDVRNELGIDIVRLTKKVGSINAIVITGDIAFAGKAEDYTVAKEWLEELCKLSGCQTENVWVVPGNHDVDRDKITVMVRTAQDKIQSAEITQLDNQIRQFFQDESGAMVLGLPMSEYNKFAAIYGCQPSPNRLTWTADLALNQGYKLRLVGLNSALISNDKDHAEKRPLVLGQAQLDLPRKAGILYLTLCHHPLNWLKDKKTAESKLNSRVAIQLFGHVHTQALEIKDDSLVVQAGALQPDRHEDPWYPAFNLIQISIEDTENTQLLSIKAFPRIWSSESRFETDPSTSDSEYVLFQLPIDEAAKADTSIIPTAIVETSNEPGKSKDEGGHDMANALKKLTYAFLTLAYSKQMRIAGRLSLLANEDAGLDNAALFQLIYARAEEQGKLGQFWNVVAKEAQTNVDMSENPYH